MYFRMTQKMQKLAEKMEQEGRTEFKCFKRPRLREYTLVKYEDNKIVSRERVVVDESEIYPSDEDYFWEPKDSRL